MSSATQPSAKASAASGVSSCGPVRRAESAAASPPLTGTGIHERQGRQHLREDKIAHVMNDETQRKYLQSVKRLMTFGQRAMPPTGPSKAVLNG